MKSLNEIKALNEAKSKFLMGHTLRVGDKYELHTVDEDGDVRSVSSPFTLIDIKGDKFTFNDLDDKKSKPFTYTEKQLISNREWIRPEGTGW